MGYLYHTLTVIGLYAIACLSLNLVMGFGGIPSIAHFAIIGVSAYSAAYMMVNLGWPFWGALLIAILTGTLFGAVVILISLPFKEDIFALVTFAMAIIAEDVFRNSTWTGGPMGIAGIPRPRIFFVDFASEVSYFVLVALFLAFSVWITLRVVSSPFGRALRAIRDDETAAEAIGKDAKKIKFVTFLFSAAVAGAMGAFMASFYEYIDARSFNLSQALLLLGMVVLGGMGSVWGSLAGASALILLPEALRFAHMPNWMAANARQLIYGILLIVLMLKRPQGLLGEYKLGMK